jgi:cation transport ATPase
MIISTDMRPVLVTVSVTGLTLGLVASWYGHGDWSGGIWATTTIPILAALLVEIVLTLRRGDVGLDIVAALSMVAAMIFGEYLAACVVALMYSGGQYLEAFAERHARREMTELLARVPRNAVRHRNNLGGRPAADPPG